MIISQTCNYALRAMLYLASHEGSRRYIPVSEIAGHLGISFHYLTKIVQTLTAGELTNSYRGPHGGVSLLRRAEQITLAEIVVRIDGRQILSECFLGVRECTSNRTCPLFGTCREIRQHLGALLGGMTVGSLAHRAGSDDVLRALFSTAVESEERLPGRRVRR